MELAEQEQVQRAAAALVYNVLDDRKQQIQSLLARHGKVPCEDLSDLFLQVCQASNERGAFFDGDLTKESEQAGYFGFAALAPFALKGAAGLSQKVKDAIAKLKAKDKTDADGNKIKLKDRLKGIFSKDGVKVEDLLKDPEGRKALKELDPDDEGDDDEKSELILGMKKPVFYGLLFLVILIVIVLIVVYVRHRKKKKLEEAAKK